MKRALVVAALAAAGLGVWLLVGHGEKKPPAAPISDEQSASDQPDPAALPIESRPPRRLAGRPVVGGGLAPRHGAGEPGAAPGGEGSARPGSMGAGIGTGDVRPGAPPRVEIIEPPADSTDIADRTARLAAEAYRNVTKALKLDADQEDKFKQVLYDSRQSYEAAMAMAHQTMDRDKLDIVKRASGESEARRKAWEDQKIAAEETLKDLLSEQQMKVYRAVVQNPLFLANGLRFKVNEESGQKP